MRFLIGSFLLFVSQIATAQAKDPSFAEISRCFFIYGAIVEVGRDERKPQLFQFAQSRVGWVSGYMQANQNNQAFKAVFDSGLSRNKQEGVRILDSLPSIISRKDQTQFSAVISRAADCDKALGIRTAWIPPLE